MSSFHFLVLRIVRTKNSGELGSRSHGATVPETWKMADRAPLGPLAEYEPLDRRSKAQNKTYPFDDEKFIKSPCNFYIFAP